MRYTVTVAGRSVEVNLAQETAALHAVAGTPLRQLIMDGRSDLFAVVRTETGWQVSRAGEHWDVQVVDERTRALQEMTGAGKARTGDQTIKAPMPGLVLRLEVEEGQVVTPGVGLVVREAMKMENEIRAHSAGTVRRIHVKTGQAVEKGTPLLEIEA
jgi:pyruvate carboxylase subunit B